MTSETRPAPAPDVSWTPLFGWLFSSLVLLGLGGILSSLGFGPWYDALRKPWFQPPGWVFSPAWILILSLLAVATARVLPRPARGAIFGLYVAQWVLNAGWSLFFFAMKRPDLALVDIALLDLVLLAMIFVYGRRDRIAGGLLVPYVLWLGLATAINVWIVLNNSV